MMRIAGLLVVVWLVVGAIAAGQRGYFTHASQTCASAGTIAVTVIAGTAYLLKWTYAGQRGYCRCRSGGWGGLSADVSGVSVVVS
jgi:membrane protein YdbS with pleckstrin-like domain